MLDALIALYRNPRRSKKWYHRLLFRVFDLAVVQAWILYTKDCEEEGMPKPAHLSLMQFKLELAECLMVQKKVLQKKKTGRQSLEVEPQVKAKKKKVPTAVVPPLSVRTDNCGHWPLHVADKGRCKLPQCKGFSRVMCEKCKLHLCLTKDTNCFKKFHKP